MENIKKEIFTALDEVVIVLMKKGYTKAQADKEVLDLLQRFAVQNIDLEMGLALIRTTYLGFGQREEAERLVDNILN